MLIELNNIKAVPASRPRVGRRGTYYSKTYREYKQELKALYKEYMSFFPDQYLQDTEYSALVTDIVCVYALPKSFSRKKRGRLFGKYCKMYGDKDNIEKGILDAMSGVVYDDDRQITSGRTEKVWGDTNKIIIDINRVEF
jgi:Holliday junction resolvase RusA-like endonuclease